MQLVTNFNSSWSETGQIEAIVGQILLGIIFGYSTLISLETTLKILKGSAVH